MNQTKQLLQAWSDEWMNEWMNEFGQQKNYLFWKSIWKLGKKTKVFQLYWIKNDREIELLI